VGQAAFLNIFLVRARARTDNRTRRWILCMSSNRIALSQEQLTVGRIIMSVVIGRDNHYTNAITCLAAGAWRRKGVGGSYSLALSRSLSAGRMKVIDTRHEQAPGD